MFHPTSTGAARPLSPAGHQGDGCWPDRRPATSGSLLTSWPDFLIDGWQRGVLFLDLLRQRGNGEVEITSRPFATVLSFAHEVLMDGRSLPRPINYALSRIVPAPGIATDPRKRPVVVIDPRAGQGSGIGGFKAESEIGDALNAGHPVYFIGLGAVPAPGQQFLDVVEGQIKFFERVAELHPDAPRPFAIGNCQAGYQTLMVAMLRPDLFGPCLVVGSPMSYWQGVHGKDPMRYSGGLSGGSWITAMTSDLGAGIFDGAWLIENFDSLNPAYTLWGKQYEVYADIDTGAERFLNFEKWWGDFIQLNGDEMQFLVDNLFIGDRLARNELRSTDGTIFDLRRITSPIIVFASDHDNISPPPQALGWILDIHRDVEDIRAAGQTIVYALNHKVGHLALFVSAKVGAKEDEEFVRSMDVIDCLPPGLYEMIISPRPADLPSGGLVAGDWIARFEARSLDDIRGLGRNSLADDRAFAAVARLSEINLTAYRTFVQPWVRAVANPPSAELARALHPLKLSYTLFADKNPWMTGVKAMAAEVAAHRMTLADDNPFLALQAQVSDRITSTLDAYRAARDQMSERIFFGVYGSPFVQALLGVGDQVRPAPGPPAEAQAQRAIHEQTCAAKLQNGGFDEALARAVLYVTGAELAVDPPCALALSRARQHLVHLSLDQFKALVREQLSILETLQKAAVDALSALAPKADDRQSLLAKVQTIVGTGGAPIDARLARLSQVWASPLEAAGGPEAVSRCSVAPA